MNKDFPRIITLLRKERHTSQKAAAADLGVQQALLSHYEKGKRECGLDFVVKVADYYNVSTDYLLGRSAVTSGSVITESDIPETEQRGKAMPGNSLTLSLSKKLITNSVDIIYTLLGRSGNNALCLAVTSILDLTVYKVFRLVYRSNHSNPQTMFEIPDEHCCHYADAGIHVAEAQLMSAIRSAPEAPEINPVFIEGEFPKQSPALLSLIKTCESQLKKTIKNS